MLKASTRSFPLLMAPAGRVADEPELRPYAGFETQARRRWRAARNDARALPGARALGGMGDAPARRDLLRVIFERGIAFQHEAQAWHPRCPRSRLRPAAAAAARTPDAAPPPQP